MAKNSILNENIWKSGDRALFRQRYQPSIAYRLALVAEGRYDGMIALGRTWEWDICAGYLLVSEAGGIVTTNFGNKIVFNSKVGSSKGVVAGNPSINKSIINELKI